MEFRERRLDLNDRRQELLDRNQLIEVIHELLPDPIQVEIKGDGLLRFVGGEFGEAIVEIGNPLLSIETHFVRYEKSRPPELESTVLIALDWRKIPIAPLETHLRLAIKTAIQIRQNRFGVCSLCGKMKPPESMHHNNICRSCSWGAFPSFLESTRL